MRVIATKLGIYGSDRIRKGQSIDIPDGEELRSWMVSADSDPDLSGDESGDESGDGNPQTLGELADPVPDVLKPEKKFGKKSGR